VTFDRFGIVNPSYTFPAGDDTITVSFGTHFEGQEPGATYNSLANTSPTGPLTLAWSTASVATQFDLANRETPVLGGVDGAGRYTTPLAILFDNPVGQVCFTLGHLIQDSAALVEAFDAAGTSLGLFGDLPYGNTPMRLSATDEESAISGVSIYMPEGMIDLEGFGIHDIGFSLDNGGPVIPEPTALVVWSLLGLVAGTTVWVTRHHSAR
jgi:hypothetical protein